MSIPVERNGRGRQYSESGARLRESCPGDQIRIIEVGPQPSSTLKKLNSIPLDNRLHPTVCKVDDIGAWNASNQHNRRQPWFQPFTDDYIGVNATFFTQVNSIKLRCILDTGAGVNLISTTILGRAVKNYAEILQPTDTRAQNVEGKRLNLVGRITLTMSLGNTSHLVTFEVTDEGSTMLLGNKFLYNNDVRIVSRKGFGTFDGLDNNSLKDKISFPVFAAENLSIEKNEAVPIQVRSKMSRREWRPLVNRPFLTTDFQTDEGLTLQPALSAMSSSGTLVACIANTQNAMDTLIEEGTYLGMATTEFSDGENLVSYIMADFADIHDKLTEKELNIDRIPIEEIIKNQESLDYQDVSIEPPGFEADGPKPGGVYVGKRSDSMFDTQRENEGSTVESARIHFKNPRSVAKLRDILHKHKSIFSKHNYDIGHFMIDGVVQKVKLSLTDTTPIVEKYRMIAPQKRQAAIEILDQLEKSKIISRRASEFASQAVWVLKALPDITPEKAQELGVEYVPGSKDPTAKRNLRFCQDYRQLNARLHQVQWPLPSVKNVLGRLKKSKFITILDASHSFFCIELDDQSKIYTGFQTCERHMVMNRLAMGLKCSSGILNACLARTLQGLEYCVIPYSDNIMIISETEEQHIKDVDKVLQALKDCNWKFKLNKCHWAVSDSLKVFGMMINLKKGTIKPDPEKSKALRELPLPTKKKQLRAFLGGIGYFVECLPDIGEHLAEVQELIKHTYASKGETITWSAKSMAAFRKITKTLNAANEIFMPDWSKPFHLVVDAGPRHTATMLVQLTDDLKWVPLGFYYKKLSDTEAKLSQVEKEALAVVYGLRQTSYYVAHSKTFIHSDNKPFVMLKKYSGVNTKLARWKLWIDSFDHELVWENSNSPAISFTDFLSRPPSQALKNKIITKKDIESIPDQVVEGVFNPSQYEKILEEILSKDGSEGHSDQTQHALMVAMTSTIPGVRGKPRSSAASRLDKMISVRQSRHHNLMLGEPSRVSLVGKQPTTPEEALVELTIRETPFLNLDRLRELQRTCSKLGTIYNNIALYPEYLIHDGLLLRRYTYGDINRLLMTVPVCLADDLVSDLHRGTTAVHHGSRKLLQLIRSRYFIPDVRKRVGKIVGNCGICAYYKPKIGTAGGIRTDAKKIKAYGPGDIWSMDHIQIVSQPDGENRTSLLCFVDMYSHFVVCTAVPKTITSQFAANIFLEHIIARYGVPRGLLSDNGPDMDGQLWRETCNLLGIQKLTIAAGSAKSNGICEKVQGLILNAIRYRSAQFRNPPRNFADIAIWAALAHNATPFQDVNPPLSPAEIFLGRSIAESSFFAFANAAFAYNNLEEFNKKMVAAQMTISEVINSKNRYLEELNYKKKLLKAPKWDFLPGTLVALKDKTQATKEANIKLRPRYRGVFIVVQQSATTCLIRPYSSESIMRDMETDLEATRGRGHPIPKYKVLKVDKGDLKKLKHLIFYSQPMAKKFMEHLRVPRPDIHQEYMADDDDLIEENKEEQVGVEDPEDMVQGAKRGLPHVEVNEIPVAKKGKTDFPFQTEW